MVRRFLLIAMLAVAAPSALLVAGDARAQGANDDRFFMLRDPFRRGPFSREPYAPFPRELPPPPQYVNPPEPRYEAPAGTAYGSAVEADADTARGKPVSEYVLVVGDTLAEQLAQGLAEAFFGERPEVAVIKKVRPNSGLLRADFYDWVSQAPLLAASEKATAVVVMLGANDRQQMRDETGLHEPRSDRWRELYAKRIDDLLARLKDKKVPVFLVGAPPMRNARLSDDMTYINEILQESAQKAGAFYVDIWEAFVDESGEFMVMGPALDGQRRRLRIGDGVHFTRAGARKAAHYVERDLSRLFDQRGTAPLVPQVTVPETPVAPVAPAARPVAGPILPLNQSQAAAGGGALAGGQQTPQRPLPAAIDTNAARILVEGLPQEPVTGRADDFRWQRPRTAVPPAAGQAAVPAPNTPR
jgi:uncharacterized protein